MSFYNMLHGVNSNAEFLLKILDIDQSSATSYSSGRFRDIYLNEDGTKILLLTRNGGGNREAYEGIFDSFQSHPNYITDYDDDSDCTYAYIEFSVPKEFEQVCKEFSTGVEK